MAQGWLQEDNPAAMALFAWWCWGSFGRGGVLSPGLSKSRPAREVRLLGTQPGVPGHAPACQGHVRGFSGEGPAEEVALRRGLLWEECGSAGCDDSRPHTSRKCRERNQVEGANKAGAPGRRLGGGALPGTCPRDDSGKRPTGEEERE